MSTDVLSEVFRAVRLSGAVFFTLDGTAPWVAEAPAAKWIAPHVMPGAEHVIEYHALMSGECWAGLIGEPPVRLRAGDVIVFPQGDAHTVSSAPHMRGPQALDMFHPRAGRHLPLAVSIAGSGSERAQAVCGFIGCDARPFNPLLATLPRVMHMPNQDAWVQQLIHLAVVESEARRPGSEGMLARLSELLFIAAVRHQLASLPDDTTGWLAGLRDDVIGRTLGVLHDRPAAPWSLEELAKEVGLSRSMLAERFLHFVVVPPMRYLARWRMQLAASLLSANQLALAEVAERVGYGSEAALSRAFKRLVGVAPAAWRDGVRPTLEPAPTDAELQSDLD
jgi:AraC-like DNA-binding protein